MHALVANIAGEVKILDCRFVLEPETELPHEEKARFLSPSQPPPREPIATTSRPALLPPQAHIFFRVDIAVLQE